jgi:GTP cyclohydrolase I
MKANGKINGISEQAQFKMNGVDTLETAYEDYDIMGENHVYTGLDTPLKSTAFDISEADKMETIASHFREIMNTMGLDLNDDSLQGTPRRVAKMFVKEIFSGLNPENKPAISLFDNKFKYGQMLVEKNIRVQSTCEHHFLPIFGRAHVAYISSGKVIGLSKINRIVDYYARRPQVQERMTVQIANELKKVLDTEDVAVIVDAKHLCVASRGIEDDSSTTLTAAYYGKFKEEKVKDEFLKYVSLNMNT